MKADYYIKKFTGIYQGQNFEPLRKKTITIKMNAPFSC